MLKTNSKKAQENVRKYIVENFGADYCTECGYADFSDREPSLENFADIADGIQNAVFHEKVKHDKRRMFERDLFEEWTQGLPSALECEYYYKSAIEILGDILEETEEERNRFDEIDAEKLLTKLIYREIYR